MVKTKYATIPMANLNCRHCTLRLADNCRFAGFEEVRNPDTYYCLKIFQNYSAEAVKYEDKRVQV